jgi:ribosomal protein S12 methylthiotransferase accessory factor YcaO
MSAWFPERPRASIVLVPSPNTASKELLVGAFAARPDAHVAVRKALRAFIEAANGTTIAAAFTEAWEGHDAEMAMTGQQAARFLVPG